MAWLDDLIKGIRQVAGNAVDVYGNTRGFAESGISEMLAGGPTMNTLVPKAKASEGEVLGGQSYPTSSKIGGVDPLTGKVNSVSPNGLSSGGSGTGGGTPAGGNPNGGIDLAAVLAEQRRRKMGEIDNALGLARGYRDEVLGQVGKKRDEYNGLWTQGEKDITSTFEGEKGNSRRTAQDLTSIEGNRARALGLGGSATDYAASRRSEALGRDLGDINTNKSNNVMENKRTLDTRLNQADAWESDANRNYSLAEQNAQSARNSASDTSENTLIGFLDKILSSQLAINATKSGVSADKANPFAVDTSKLANGLNGASFLSPSTVGNTGAAQDGNPVDVSLIAQLLNPTKYKSNLYGQA